MYGKLFLIKESHRLYPATFGKRDFFIFGQNSEIRTQCVCKNIKVKAFIEYHKENTQPECSIPRTCQKVFEEFRKIRKTVRRAFVMKYILNKIADM